jgi:hypothetical protein
MVCLVQKEIQVFQDWKDQEAYLELQDFLVAKAIKAILVCQDFRVQKALVVMLVHLVYLVFRVYLDKKEMLVIREAQVKYNII